VARAGSPVRSLHVGRYLAVLLAVLVVLYGVVLLAGPGSRPLTPTLALDLQGGASVTLLARPDGGQEAQPEQLSTAVDIIRQRVNGAGVSEAEVVVQGQNIVVSVPGGNRASIRNVTQTAQLRFREVLDSAPGSSEVAPPPELLTPPTADEASPTATPSAAGRAVPRALLAQSSPSATPSPATPAPTGEPAPTPTPAPAPAGDQPVRSGSPATDESFAALDCSREENRRGTGSTDAPDEQIVACDADGSTKYRLDVAQVVGTDVEGATAGRETQGTGAWQVVVDFTGEGQDKFSALTEATVGKQVAIVLDGVVQSAPTINQRIDAEAQITGSFDQDSAQELANVLRYGALPLTFVAQEEQTVSPTLGSDQLRSGLLAGGLGLLAVVVYSLLYYRFLGFVTVASLLVSGALTYAMVCILGQQIGFALSLAGIAGFIVAVGITADSFVVFFERLKDEIKEGRAPRAAVDRAWVRARRTILSADTVSFLAAVILYFVSVGSVRGFAFTLGLSTLIDVVVVFLFTRPTVSLLSRYRWFSRSRTTGFFGPDGGEPVSPVPAGRPRTAAASEA
jgi:preprotein translocase subunit SecD